jgi:exonuclease III
VRLLSWNVQGKLGRLPEQAASVASLEPDLVCLQEITRNSAPLWEHALTTIGLSHQFHLPPGPGRRLCVLIAGRTPFSAEQVAGVPWPERALSARFEDFELVGMHSPVSQTREPVKVPTHEAVFAHLAAPASHPRLLCGDLNTPRKGHADGTVWTFARDHYGRLRPERGERWDAAESSLIRGLEPFGFRDAFRSLHGFDSKEPTWEWPRWGGGWRLDHLIVSADVDVPDCHYLHDWRREGLSDHSPLVAELSCRSQL